jgi:hypothetical protein
MQKLSLILLVLALVLGQEANAQAVFRNKGAKVQASGKVFLVVSNGDFDNQGEINGNLNLRFAGQKDQNLQSSNPLQLGTLELANKSYQVLIKDNIEVRDSIVLQLANLNLQNQVVQFGTKNRAIVRGESGSAKIIGLEKGSLGVIFSWKEGLAFSAGDLGLEIPKAPLTDEILVNRGASALANDAMKAIRRWLWVRSKAGATDKLPNAAKVRLYYQDYELNGLEESKLGFWALNPANNTWVNCKVSTRNGIENWVEAENVPLPAYLSLGVGTMTTSTREVQEMAAKIKLRVFPNPSTDWINIQFEVPDADQQLILECLDASGRLVFSEQVKAGIGTYTLEKSLGHLSAGIYTLRLAGFPRVSTRLIKQ